MGTTIVYFRHVVVEFFDFIHRGLVVLSSLVVYSADIVLTVRLCFVPHGTVLDADLVATLFILYLS